MDATQEYLMKLILEIDDICKKYDIQYFLEYGTILGAVRHKGFIPWDDDVDIIMTEENYYKWIKACEKELDPSKRIYLDVRVDRRFPTVFGRYHDVESARVSSRSEFWEPTCGQCIDVFCLLELPGDPEKKRKAIDLYYAYDEYSNSSYRHFRMKTERRMQLYKRLCFWEKIFGKERVLRYLEKKIFHKHYDDCDTYICTSARTKQPSSIVPKACYDSVYMADYEGHKLPIPGKYMDLLTLYYGDTYCMIPEKKRVHAKMSHTGIGCKQYVSDYMRLIDKDTLLRDRQKFKHIAVEEGYRMTNMSRELYEKLAYCEILKIHKKIQEKQINVKDYLVADDRDKLQVLDQIFSDYYKKQMSASVRLWHCYFPLEDDLVYAALFNLIYYRNDFSTASEILHMRELNDIPFTPELDQIMDRIHNIREIKAAIVYGDYEEARACLERGLEHYAAYRELRICQLILDIQSASDEKQYAACEKMANELLELYPEDDQCMKALGDIAFARGNRSEAQKYYDWVMENSINAMLHMDIKTKIGANA